MNFYKILNCNINDNQQTIKKNYYKLCKKYHPDKTKQNNDSQIKNINLAYEVLGNPDKRYKYDLYVNKKNKSKIDYLQILDFIYNSIYNDILKALIKNIIINYLSIDEIVTITFEDYYNQATHKIKYNIKNYDTKKNIELEQKFCLNKLNYHFENKGDVYDSFKGHLNITLDIDYNNYDNLCIMNDKLFITTNKKDIIKLPNNKLDISNIEWSNTKLGTISIIPNYGLLNNDKRDELVIVLV
jgi:curved DNA-binding protein CbpA